ncbi:MAG: hypothetical protein KDI46_03120 [Alphaproteobacteria bacterium]|nr:hypothetical protein [Alphaproteobacteria bacterium]
MSFTLPEHKGHVLAGPNLIDSYVQVALVKNHPHGLIALATPTDGRPQIEFSVYDFTADQWHQLQTVKGGVATLSDEPDENGRPTIVDFIPYTS